MSRNLKVIEFDRGTISGRIKYLNQKPWDMFVDVEIDNQVTEWKFIWGIIPWRVKRNVTQTHRGKRLSDGKVAWSRTGIIHPNEDVFDVTVTGLLLDTLFQSMYEDVEYDMLDDFHAESDMDVRDYGIVSIFDEQNIHEESRVDLNVDVIPESRSFEPINEMPEERYVAPEPETVRQQSYSSPSPSYESDSSSSDSSSSDD